MSGILSRFRPIIGLAAACMLLGMAVVARAEDRAAGKGPLVGLDHIPLVVRDLDRASETYRRLGFVLKPGRVHADGIRNRHVKFVDGSGIELITAPEPVDELTSTYLRLLVDGEGPAFLAFHARDTSRLVDAMREGGFACSRKDALFIPALPGLDCIFFVRDNRSPTDRPEHFAHANCSSALIRVWLATDDGEDLQRLLTALGASARADTVLAPDPVAVTVVTVENGEVVFLPASHQVIRGRPIVGAAFRVADAAATARQLTAAGLVVREDASGAGVRRLIVPPEETHGIWLTFEE